MNTFNNELDVIEGFSNTLEKDLSIKLVISEYIKDNDDFLNQDFFGKIENVNDEYINDVLLKISFKLEEFKKIKIDIKKNNKIPKLEKNFLLQVLNKRGFELIRLQNSIYLEAEKAGYNLSEEDRKKYLNRITLIDKILYGNKVSDNKQEVDLIFDKLFSLYQKKSVRLTQEENKVFLDFAKEFNRSINNQEKIVSKKEKKEKKENEILKKNISINKVKEIFDLVIGIYGLDGWKAEIGNHLAFGVSFDKKIIKIPKSKKHITVKKLLELIDHEIGVHAIRGFNTEKTLKSFYLHYAEAEEGFAKLSNSLFENDLEEFNVDVNIALISTFIAENYDGDKTKELLKIYFKLSSKNELEEEELEKKAQDRTLRVKKHYSLKEKGAYRKDASYFRGENQIIEHLLSEDDIKGFIKAFYFSKLSLDDLEIVGEIKQVLDYDEDELIYPLWIGKILFRKLLGEKVTLKTLREGDPRFDAIENISIKVKKGIIKILNIIKEED